MKKSFILYCDTLAVLDHLTDEQAGQLFKAIKSYQSNQETELDPIIRVAFTSFEAHFVRDDEKYQHICERNRVNGAKGGRPKEPKKPNGLNGNPKNLDSDTDNDNDIDKPTTTSKPPACDPVPFNEIIDLYHKTLPNNPQIASLSASRKQQIKARWNNGIPDLDSWERYFSHVADSKFLTGQSNPGMNRNKPFVANIDFPIKEANVLKIIEGNYHE